MAKVISAGSLLVKSKLPKAVQDMYDPSKLLDKKGVGGLMEDVVKHGGDDAHTSIQDLSDLFFGKATEHGYTTPLNDYDNDSRDRQVMIGEFSDRVTDVNNNKKLNEREKSEKLNELSGVWAQKIWDQNQSYMVQKGSTAGKMAMTGARGNKMQFGQGTATPVMAQDIKGNPIPIAIKRSFAEGLKPAEHIAMSYGGRASTVKTQLSTSKPGALFKEITPNVFHEVVTVTDCKTVNGVMARIEDKKRIINHTIAGSHDVITELKYKDLLNSGEKFVKVRSTLTCEAKDGVCQYCYGYDSYGQFPRLGQNVGVIAAQSVSEVLTQAMLATKHKGGVAGKGRDAFAEVENLLYLKENFLNEATVAHVNGKVTKITKDSLNAHRVYIGETEHFVPAQYGLLVEVGDTVKKGDALSEGTVHPRKIVELKGLGSGRKYFSEALREAYGIANPNLDPRHFDMIARNVMKYVTVKDPGDTGFVPGQLVEVSRIQNALQEDEAKHRVNGDLVGKTLSRGILELTPGTILDRNHVDYLHGHGVSEVNTSKSGLHVIPIVKGVKTSKLDDPNWMSRLALNRQEATLTEAAAKGEKAKIHSTDPIASYVLGTEFGEGGSGFY